MEFLSLSEYEKNPIWKIFIKLNIKFGENCVELCEKCQNNSFYHEPTTDRIWIKSWLKKNLRKKYRNSTATSPTNFVEISIEKNSEKEQWKRENLNGLNCLANSLSWLEFGKQRAFFNKWERPSKAFWTFLICVWV